MPEPHEPRDEFVERLEGRIVREAHRRLARPVAPVIEWSRMRLAAAAAALVLVSMGVGGAVVAAAYQAQANQVRETLMSAYGRRVEVAQQRLALANEALQTAVGQANVGVASQTTVLSERQKVIDAEVALGSARLQLDEVRITGQEPRNDISAPLVGGRDFVTERLRNDMMLPERTLAIEAARSKDLKTRIEIGVTSPLEIEVLRVRESDLQTPIEALRKKIDIRQKFLAGSMDSVEADLRVLEADTEQRLKALRPKIDLTSKQVDNLAVRLQAGTAEPVEVAQARLRLLEMQAELLKAQVDLSLVQSRIVARRAGK